MVGTLITVGQKFARVRAHLKLQYIYSADWLGWVEPQSNVLIIRPQQQ